MQGLHRPVYGKVDPASGEAPVESLEIAQPGTQGKAQFDQTVRDITACLEYAGEPAAIKSQSLGVWVILFLAFFTFLTWVLKKENWSEGKYIVQVTGGKLREVMPGLRAWRAGAAREGGGRGGYGRPSCERGGG